MPLPTHACRLCDGETDLRFHKKLLDRHETELRLCRTCGSLQTGVPHWLAEAYDYEGCAHPADAGYMGRNIEVARLIDALLTDLDVDRAAPILDRGGGIGILARILRERGWNVFSHDAYQEPVFSDIKWPGSDPHVVIAVELFEHFPNPAIALAELFATRPAIVYVRTDRYSGQGDDWWYLSPESGQHVFFYSDKAMHLIGEKFGYAVELRTGEEAIFTRHRTSD